MAGNGLAATDPGPPVRKKKDFKIEAQLIVDGIPTIDPYLVRVLQALKIYRYTGHPIWPWQVDSLPSDWKDAILSLADATPIKKG